jgi:protein gp37
LEYCGWLHRSYCRLHELLRHADGGQAGGDGHREVPWPHPEKRRTRGLDGKIRLDHASLDAPTTWSKPRKVFVNSMSDLFHDDVPIEFIVRVWDVMKETPRHTYQILTKRPERMAEVLTKPPFKILSNVWLGASIEDDRVLYRLDAIRQVPAAIRFVSLEPLIGSVAKGDLTGINWAIVGGESGPRAREMKPEWVDEIEAMCRSSGSAFFFKQWGGKNKKAAGRMLNSKTYDEMPELRL